jgi:polyphosphate kinase
MPFETSSERGSSRAGESGGRAMAERGKSAKAKGGAGSAPAAEPVVGTDHRNGHHKGHGDGGKGRPAAAWPMTNKGRLERKFYESELARLDVELNRLQEWIKHAGLKIVVLFEGRDAAGKGGTIKTISASLNPRICRVVALGTPSDRQKTQWYFQRYAEQLPAAGEMVLFDRSWYNRAGVERVMGFCTEEEYREFLRSAPEFERMLQRSGITILKYWFSVSDDEQERRFQARLDDPTKRWKLSPMDLESRTRWVEYSRAKDEMFAHTDTKTTPWIVVPSDDKRRARLNVIQHLLSVIPYKAVAQPKLKLPPRQSDIDYIRPPVDTQTFVPDRYGG